MSGALDVLTIAAVCAGAFFFLAGTVGLLRFPDTLTRLHALTKADNLALGLVVSVCCRARRGWPASAAQVAEAVRFNTETRLRALKIGFVVLAGLAMLAIAPCGWLPDYKPGEVPSGQPQGLTGRGQPQARRAS